MLEALKDTPIKRASITELTLEEATKLVEEMQERRMRAHTAYQAAVAAKAKIKEERDRARYDKVLSMFDKKLETADKALSALSKYLVELKVLELALGD